MKIVETDGSAAAPTTEDLADFVARAAADIAIGTVAEASGPEPKMGGSPDPDAPSVQAPPLAEPSPTLMPSIGRIVHTAGNYLQTDGQPYAAVITRVHNVDCVTLQVFDEGEGPGVIHSAVFGREWAWPARV